MLDIAHMMIDAAPQPVAPFSHVVRAGDFLFVTGQMPTLPGCNQTLIEGNIQAQTRQVIDNLAAVLAGADSGMQRIVSARIYLTHFQRDYQAVNRIWESTFPAGRLPARTCVGVSGLALDALVEIDLIAAC